MSSKIHKIQNQLSKIIGLVLLGSVVACNFCKNKPGDNSGSKPLPVVPEASAPPIVPPPYQAMIEKATAAKYSILAKILQELKDGSLVNIDALEPPGLGSLQQTALHSAAELGDVAILQLLLEHNAEM